MTRAAIDHRLRLLYLERHLVLAAIRHGDSAEASADLKFIDAAIAALEAGPQ